MPQSIHEKKARLGHLLAPFHPPEIAVFPSPSEECRMRAEFRIWHDTDGSIHYAMAPKGEKMRQDTVIRLNAFPLASLPIQKRFLPLLERIRNTPILKEKLYQVEFLSSTQDDLIITLIYHRPLDEAWTQLAQALSCDLRCHIIGRSRKQKIVLGREYVNEVFNVAGRAFYYRQYEQSFSQPNAYICEQMLNWVVAAIPDKAGNEDLLELYCGNGNFTLPLAQRFKRVLATEISKKSVQALKENCALNHADNIALARLSAQELSMAFAKVRPFQRLKEANIDLDDYRFSTVFVDPPRSGIDPDTLKLLQRFPTIIYVSCNPETLAENLKVLCQSHRIECAALFDQFPNSAHMESAVVLKSLVIHP